MAWSPLARALSCDDIMKLVSLKVPTHTIVIAVKESTEPYSDDTLSCLTQRKAPTPVIEQVRAGLGTKPPQSAPTEPPAPPQIPPPKFDCLAGVCLNAKSGPLAPSLVTVSERKWTRKVEVCSGRVVSIGISAAWSQPGFTWTDIFPASTTKLNEGEDASEAADVYKRMVLVLGEMGWSPSTAPGDDIVGVVFQRFDVMGRRGVFLVRSDDYPTGWYVQIFSLHPAESALCRAKVQQGL